VISSGVSLQRSFFAVEAYSMAEGDQLRVQDYIAMDCRRAIGATMKDNTLTLTLPNYYDASGKAVEPSYTPKGALQYGPGTTTIMYSTSGSSFLRTVNGESKAIATNIDSFTVNAQDLTTSVTCSITFAPRFRSAPGAASVGGTTVFSSTFLRNAVARQ
jgi:hypothetical protein